MTKTNCFYDVEATSVSRDADIISIGIIATQNNKIISSIYAEFTDFNLDKCDDWVKENVVGKLHLNYLKPNLISGVPINGVDDVTDPNNIKLLGTTSHIAKHLKEWLSQFESIEFWADFDVIDKPMLIDLIAEWNYQNKESKGFSRVTGQYYSIIEDNYKVGLPKHLPNIRYDQFFDLHTLFKLKGIDTDTNREEFSEVRNQVIPLPFSDIDHLKHNALWDSYVSYLCYERLINL